MYSAKFPFCLYLYFSLSLSLHTHTHTQISHHWLQVPIRTIISPQFYQLYSVDTIHVQKVSGSQWLTEEPLLNTKQILLMPLARKGLDSQVWWRRRGSKFYNLPPAYQESNSIRVFSRMCKVAVSSLRAEPGGQVSQKEGVRWRSPC